MTELVEYRELPSLPGYRIGSDGTVWSRRTSSMRGKLADDWRILTGKVRPDGYIEVAFSFHGKRTCRYVHRLVLEAFVGPCPQGQECCHLDGDRSNNFLVNLKWGSGAMNSSHKALHGTKVEGSKTKNAVTNERDVAVIKRFLEAGVKHKVIAYAFELNTAVIDGISSGKNWAHVTSEAST